MNIIEIDQQRKNGLLKLFFTLFLIVQIILIILFLYLKYYELLFLGIINSCIFIVNFFLLGKKKFLLSMQIGVFTVVFGAIIVSSFLGWKSYFSLYLIASAIIIINSLSLRLNWKIFEVAVITILFIGLILFTYSGYSIYDMEPKYLEWMGLFNLFAVIFALFFMQFQNFIESENLKKKIEEFSDIDMLTGAYNRRFFNKYLDIEIKRLESQIKYRHSTEITFGIAMIDIDDFKNVNDKFGHLAGDTVIVEVAQIIKAVIFERDIFCRYGGDEFVVLFTSTSKPGAIIAIEKILRTIENHGFRINKEKLIIRVTVSMGFASFEEESNIYRLLDIADKRLYKAKKSGKNRMIIE